MGGQTKSGSQPNNEKSKGATTSHSSLHVGMKNVQSGRPTNYLGPNWSRGNTSDEFKHGFPSDGLSTSSYKWWGSKDADSHEVALQSSANVQENRKNELENTVDDDSSSRIGTKEALETEDSNVCPEGSALLTKIRRRAAKEARQAIKLGVYHDFVPKKSSNREKALLLKIFKSSLPTSWKSEF